MWIENGPFQMLFFVQKIGDQFRVARVLRCSRLTSTNRSRVPAVFAEPSTKLLPIPQVIDGYNHNISRVVIADRLHSVYHHITNANTQDVDITSFLGLR